MSRNASPLGILVYLWITINPLPRGVLVYLWSTVHFYYTLIVLTQVFINMNEYEVRCYRLNSSKLSDLPDFFWVVSVRDVLLQTQLLPGGSTVTRVF